MVRMKRIATIEVFERKINAVVIAKIEDVEVKE